MQNEKVKVSAALFQWLNAQTDLSSNQVDLVDGFVFMLQKINKHRTIRLLSERRLHPRFWRSHNRTFGYMATKDKIVVSKLYQFYIDVALTEGFLIASTNGMMITERGLEYLHSNREEQLDRLFRYIW
ncbi:hypothetical protein [Bacillus solitudinis]|uniref:hypothetical protein n=1 Tax=Bacillus solitudinis TaxID=2014074 RepID=UPI000C23FA13|nr:hypothetical protein [Bacillus solitudinis]